jgi:trk system potassium uptake protein TrkA
MNVIICGASEVGTHAAEVLAAAGHGITVVDRNAERLAAIDDLMDVRTFAGNCANADVLREVGGDDSDSAVVAATDSDEINLLTATVAKGIGAGKTIARVHHSAYFDRRGLDYRKHLNIDHLICPEYSTAQAIAAALRNPAALMIENFASGQIEMQQFPVSADAPAVGKSLVQLDLPKGMRLAAIRRADRAFLPVATTEIEAADIVILVGNKDIFGTGRKLFMKSDTRRQRLVIMGGSAMAVWLGRALRDKDFSIRLFEPDRDRAEKLAEKLDWLTVVNAEATDVSVFEDERLGEIDGFVGLSEDDEHNILGCALAKSVGVKQVISVVQRPRYVHLMKRVGIDHAFSPRIVAVRHIEQNLDNSPLLSMASLAKGVVEAYRVIVSPTSDAVGKPLKSLRLSPDWMIVAVQHGDNVRVPTADDFIHGGDTLMAVGKHGTENKLKQVFGK